MNTNNTLQLTVMCSGGFAEAYKGLIPDYEQATGKKLISVWGPSMGNSPETIPNRLARGEYADVVIMVGYSMDKLVESGQVLPEVKWIWRIPESEWW